MLVKKRFSIASVGKECFKLSDYAFFLKDQVVYRTGLLLVNATYFLSVVWTCGITEFPKKVPVSRRERSIESYNCCKLDAGNL